MDDQAAEELDTQEEEYGKGEKEPIRLVNLKKKPLLTHVGRSFPTR